MIVRQIGRAPEDGLARLLEQFESQFTYPLGQDRRFRISHGDDYPLFYRAIGEACCFVAERQGRVAGVICAALRRLQLPGGGELVAGYFGDLKVDPTERRTRTLLTLAQAATAWLNGRVQAAYSVVMDGTSAVPSRYTGRLRVPLFSELGRICVLRLPTAGLAGSLDDSWTSTHGRADACYRALAAGHYAGLGGFPEERSQMAPTWLVHSSGHACGRLEDTRRAKRLYADDGSEMLSAHLSCFAFRDVAAGVLLLAEACARAAANGYPALFVAVPASAAERLCSALGALDFVIAPATVFGAGLERSAPWSINTAEI